MGERAARPGRSRWAGVALVVLVLLAGGALVAHGWAARSPSLVLAPDAKQTCVYSGNRIDRLTDFEHLVGERIDCAVVFNDVAPSWPAWEDAWFVSAGADQPELRWPAWMAADRPRRTLVITQSLVPTDAPADWRARGAASRPGRPSAPGTG